jgi:hypothetical protein
MPAAERSREVAVEHQEHVLAAAIVGQTDREKVNLFKLGRMPAQAFVDRAGVARFVHYGHNMSDIPDTAEFLALVEDVDPAAVPGF